MNNIPYHHTAKEIKDEINKLTDDASNQVIEETAHRLEGLNYAPPITTPMEKFLRINKGGIMAEIERILNMSAEEACTIVLTQPSKCEDIKVQTISILFYYYKELLLLRAGDGKTWDDIDEMYLYD
ncbi:hypothetical protein [Desulfotalea psychrophila]|uniref:Uncharacterized protein n=1 Tax=Desulfotalea psychrophila (strain LSv54 / DSM 12343) TaxID=177439 RepID=Q6ARB5_DESPS|nr:hypothetical protein [Desulfotalea psychrophila]CAG35109.1 unknown protein [Desulfotalea psychrophila LSv54]